MYGRKASSLRTQSVCMIKVARYGIDGDNSIFVPVFPRGTTITDILLHRPYVPGEEVTVKFYDDDTVMVLEETGVMTNKLHAIDIAAAGAVACEVWSPNIKEIFISYKV